MKKILIANRGEIAVRIIRACRDAGYAAVAVAAEVDRGALHARLADELHVLKGNSPRDTYLNQAALLQALKQSGADAVHPGYGFLSENESFAAAVQDAGITWIGPSAETIALLGDKVNAREVARKAGAPLLPSLGGSPLTLDSAREFVAEHGFPVIVKAQNGGGGRGMRIVRELSELEAQMAAAKREASIAFGRSECFIERYIEHARHVETQCLADTHGQVIILSTRDCTLQRRHQKLIEEAPAPFLEKTQLETLVAASTRILHLAKYRGAGTCEFLVTPEGAIYFLEVNTRVQVEHPVTEEVTGVDIIREMFRIAEGEHINSAAPEIRGHSVEFRINAEDPWDDFRPSPGRLAELRLPGGPGVRLDFGYTKGETIPPYYDSLVGKLIVTGDSREQALVRARRALAELSLGGIPSLTPLYRAILACPEFSAATAHDFKVHTRWIDTELPRLAEAARALLDEVAAGAADESLGEEPSANAEAQPDLPHYRLGIKAPLSGVVLELCVKEGDRIAPGDTVAIMESMKMEQSIVVDTAGVVAKINTLKGAFVEMDEDIMGID